jgi:hypothetical protein
MENNINEMQKNVAALMSGLDGILKLTDKSLRKAFEGATPEQAKQFQDMLKTAKVDEKLESAKREMNELNKFFQNYK